MVIHETKAFSLCAAALMLTLALPVSAPCRRDCGGLLSNLGDPGEDGTELKKIYDLAPEEDPAGIPGPTLSRTASATRSQTCLSRSSPSMRYGSIQRPSLPSKNKDMASVLALLPPRSVNSSPMTDSWVP